MLSCIQGKLSLLLSQNENFINGKLHESAELVL